MHPLPRQTRPMVTVSGLTLSGPPTPPVPLSQVLNLDSEEPIYHTSEDELEHRARDGSPHSQRSGERDPPPWTWMRNLQWAGTGASHLLR